jgi:hypothetical protein
MAISPRKSEKEGVGSIIPTRHGGLNDRTNS